MVTGLDLLLFFPLFRIGNKVFIQEKKLENQDQGMHIDHQKITYFFLENQKIKK